MGGSRKALDFKQREGTQPFSFNVLIKQIVRQTAKPSAPVTSQSSQSIFIEFGILLRCISQMGRRLFLFVPLILNGENPTYIISL